MGIRSRLLQAPICYLPLGVLEWHGEHNAVGLDAIKAHAVCVRAAQISGGVVAPSFFWASDTREDLPGGTYLTGGIEDGERYHVPGSMFWIRPEPSGISCWICMKRCGGVDSKSSCWSPGTGQERNMPVIRSTGRIPPFTRR